jgi:hypothetical protein
VSRAQIRGVLAKAKEEYPSGTFMVITSIANGSLSKGYEGFELDREFEAFLRAKYQIPELLKPSPIVLMSTHFSESGIYGALRKIQPSKAGLMRPELLGLNQVLQGRVQTLADFEALVTTPEKFINKSLAETVSKPYREEEGTWICRIELFSYSSL